jgi:hypothetical protein
MKLFAAAVVSGIIFASLYGFFGVQKAAASEAAAPHLLKTWVKTWGGSTDEMAHNSAIDASGNVYVAGEFSGTVDFDPDPALVDNHTSNGAQDAFLSKFGADGTFIWAKTWGGSTRDVVNGLVVDSLGFVYVSGPFQNGAYFNPPSGAFFSSNAGGMNNIFLSKFAPDGTFQWVRTWGPTDGGAESYSIALDQQNDVYVVGDYSGSGCDFNPWNAPHDYHINHNKVFFDAFLSKFDTNGTFLWAKTWGGEGYDDGPGVAVDGLGNVYVAGMYASQTIDFNPAGGGVNTPAHDSGILVDVFLSKFDANGSFQWVRTWGGPGVDDVGQHVAVDESNHVYVGGRFGCTACDFDPWGPPDLHSSQGDLDAFVSKFDQNGTFQWARTWGGPGWDAESGLVVDRWNRVSVAGIFNGTVDFDPGSGTRQQTSNGLKDAFLTQLDINGNFLALKTWGGEQDDGVFHLAKDGSDNVYAAGWYRTTVNFDPGGLGDLHSSNGMSDIFIAKFAAPVLSNIAYLPLVKK